MNILKASVSGILLLALIVLMNTKMGSVPPIGKFLDPDAGFWANAETSYPESETLTLDGLKDEVTVYFDDRRVPHVFAKNDHDLYFVQGYLQARDRLFQMELQTYDAAGRLTEIIGEGQLQRDKNTRRWGMVYGAEKAFEFVNQDSTSSEVFNAYANGVNAWISNLKPQDYPLEYKILDISPETWTPLKTALLLKNMTRTLAASSSDDRTSNTIAYFGEDFVERFFTQDPELLDPIIPRSREWDFEAEPVQAPDSMYIPASAKELMPFEPDEGVGSNNWAVSGEKTRSGYPILANDPHLNLTLPSVWYEIQLHAPGVNVYGVTFQGAPGVIIGFNENIAWGVTNVASDVLDWYEITFKDESKNEYWHDGEWKPVSRRIEEYKVRGGETVLDTVIYTHHGPVTEVRSRVNEEREPAYHAMRWIAHYPSNEIKAFYKLNRAVNYDEYVEAISHFDGPAQNFVFASNEGDIALWVNGKFPNKWKNQGRTVSDGSDPLYDWQGWIPREHNPHVKNPPRGFVSSANQESVAPDYPYYMDDDYAPFERGKRINDLLEEMEDITPEDMQKMQMDNYSYHAATILPEMLEWLDEDALTDEEEEVLEALEDWDFFNDADDRAPGVFRAWWGNLYNAIFTDEFESTKALLRYPPRDRVTEILRSDPEFAFIDDIKTEEKETLEDLVLASYQETIEELTERYGSFGENWEWGILINNDINHLAFIPGFGQYDLYSGGGSESVNATSGSTGPSWRMVVEVGPEVKGWGVYPGGPSGNPGSMNYDLMVESWRKGELFELNFYREAPDDAMYQFSMQPDKD